MSLLSDTQGTPERVFALLRLLDSLGGSAERTRVADLMTAYGTGETKQTEFTQTLGAAKSLGLVAEERGMIGLSATGCPPSFTAFTDLAHLRLSATKPDDGNTLVLDGFAFVAAQSDAHDGPHWFLEDTARDLSDDLRAFAEAKRPEGGTFNPTRFAPWLKWLGALGLVVNLGGGRRPFPDVSTRLLRELVFDRARLQGRDVPAGEFAAWVLDRMPYLPGGARFVELFGAPQWTPLSNLLSAALRDLEADGVLRFESIGDSAGSLSFSDDAVRGHRAFNTVRLLNVERFA